MKETTYLKDYEIEVLNLCKDRGLGVSSIKYSKGHDGDCTHCNLKLKNKVVGTAFDDSWGGGFQIEVNDSFSTKMKEVIDQSPTYHSFGLDMKYTWDTVIELLINQEECKKICKKNTVVLCKLNNVEKELVFKGSFSLEKEQKILDYLKENNCTEYEIVNKRFL